DTATTDIYTLSLHDALPISGQESACTGVRLSPIEGRTSADIANRRLEQLGSGKEVANFEGGCVGGVGAVRAIVLDVCAELPADGAWRGFGRIGRAHGVAPTRDGILRFKNHHHHFT